MKIAELIESYNQIAKPALTKSAALKRAFVPNPNVAPPQPQGDPQQQQQQGQPQQAPPQPPQQQQAPPQPAPQPPQASPERQPSQAGGETSPLMAEVLAEVQKLPPEAQQQIAPILEKLQSMPPDQLDQYLQSLLAQMHQMEAGGQPQAAPQQGMIAQAAEGEDMYTAMQGMQGMQQDPSAGGQPQAPQEQAMQDADHAESSAIEAKNELDNVRVSLTVRELLDLVGKGSATESLLKVKQLADTHKQKMEQSRQKAEAAQQEQAQNQQADQQGMMNGGIYPTPMGG
jgi:hypothetical protein